MAKKISEELMKKRNMIKFDVFKPKPTTVQEILSNLASEEDEKKLSEGIIDETKFYCTHSLQRKTGQWNKKDKSLLIDSIMSGYPIGDFTVVYEEDEDVNGETKTVKYILDGIQRMSTLKEFLDGKFKLLEKACANEDLYGYRFPQEEIEGDTFSRKLKNHIMNYSIAINDCSDRNQEDIRKMFLRTNGGKPLNKSQIEATNLKKEIREDIEQLRNLRIPVQIKHTLKENETKEVSFWDKTGITAIQCIRDVDRDVLMQTLYLLSLGNEKPQEYSTSFLYGEFGKKLGEMPENEYQNLLNRLKKAMKELGKYLPSIKVEGYTKIKKTSIPYALYGMDKILRNKKSTKNFGYALYQFCMDYNNNTAYKGMISGGTTKVETIENRLKYFNDMVTKLKPVDEKDFIEFEKTLFIEVIDKEPKTTAKNKNVSVPTDTAVNNTTDNSTSTQ